MALAAQSSDTGTSSEPSSTPLAVILPAREAEVPLSVLTTPHTATFTASSAGAQLALTTAGVLGLAVVVMSLGVAVDLTFADGLGLGVTLAFFVSCVGMALRLRVGAVLAAVLAAPLLFAGAAIAIAKLSGEAGGLRQLGLDVATSLALSAPILFAGTAVTLVIAIARLLGRLVRR